MTTPAPITFVTLDIKCDCGKKVGTRKVPTEMANFKFSSPACQDCAPQVLAARAARAKARKGS